MSTNLHSWLSPNCPESVEDIPRARIKRGTLSIVTEWHHPSFQKASPVWDCLSWDIFKETPILSVPMTVVHESLGNSEGNSLNWLPCYHHLLHIILHFHAAAYHLHCVWTKSQREVPACAFCQCHSPGMHPWSSLCLNPYLPWSRKASTTLLATLVSKTDLTLLASQRDSSWSFSPAPFVKDLLCIFYHLDYSHNSSPEYLKEHRKMLLSSHPSQHHLSEHLHCICGEYFDIVFTDVSFRDKVPQGRIQLCLFSELLKTSPKGRKKVITWVGL